MRKEFKKPYYPLIVLFGMSVGIWLTLSGGTLFVFLLFLSVLFILRQHVPHEDRALIFKIIIAGFLCRIIFLVLYHNFYLLSGHMDILGPDGDAYSQRGWYVSRLLLDQDPYALPPAKGPILESYHSVVEYYKQRMPSVGLYQVGMFTYFIGILFSVFDYCPLMIKFLNSGLSVLTGVLVYFLGKDVFSAKIGKVSMTVFIFMPSIFLFSITALKDSLVIFILTLIILLMVKLQKKFNILFIALILGLTILIESLRSRMAYPLILFILTSLLVTSKQRLSRKILIVLALIISFAATPKFTNLACRTFNLEAFFSSHIGFINTPGNNYKIFPDQYYVNGRLAGLDVPVIALGFLSGMFHLLFEPLPGRVDSVFSLILFFFTSAGYFFIPFVLRGFVGGLKYNNSLIMPIVIFLVIFIPLVAISEGNMGTVFRHRDIFMPFFILLGVTGFFRIAQGKKALR